MSTQTLTAAQLFTLRYYTEERSVEYPCYAVIGDTAKELLRLGLLEMVAPNRSEWREVFLSPAGRTALIAASTRYDEEAQTRLDANIAKAGAKHARTP